MRRLVVFVPLAALAVGCGGGGDGTGHPAAAPAPPAVSVGESTRVVDDYVRKYNEAVARGDAKAWRALGTDAIGATAEAQLRTNGGRPPRTAKISLVNPLMYVPRQAAYPHWFAVAAREHGSRDRPVFLMFARKSAKAAWRLADRVYFTGRPPQVALDGQGYAIAVDPRSSSALAMAPDDLPGAQSEYLGGQGGDSKIAPGPYTSRWRAAERKRREVASAHGVDTTSSFKPTGYPVYALRTTTGGALVWYTLRRTTGYTATGDATATTLPPEVRAYLGRSPTGEVNAAWMWRSIAYVPPRGRASVIIQNVDLATAS